MHRGYWWECQKEKPIGKSRLRWVDIIKIDPREIGWGGMGWIDLSQDTDQWRTLIQKNLRMLLVSVKEY
jgi:hypothetical protein